MKIKLNEIVWLLIILMLISQVGCGTKTRATKDHGSVTREVLKW